LHELVDVTNHLEAWPLDRLLLLGWWGWCSFISILIDLNSSSDWGVVAEESEVVGVVHEHWLVNSPLSSPLSAVQAALVLDVQELHEVA